jgi:hypothetical protein
MDKEINKVEAFDLDAELTKLNTPDRYRQDRDFCSYFYTEKDIRNLFDKAATSYPSREQPLREALSNLVKLKDYKDTHGKDEYYEKNQPLAWEAARTALAGEGEPQEVESEFSNALEWIVLLQSALTELVELKKIKDTQGKTADYESRQPLAWQTAFSVLDLLNKDDGFYNKIPGQVVVKGVETNKYKYCNHHHELTDQHELVDFGNGQFVANKRAIPLLKALNEAGLQTRTHHFSHENDHGFISILLDNVRLEIKTVNEIDADRTCYNGKKELLIMWDPIKSGDEDSLNKNVNK